MKYLWHILLFPLFFIVINIAAVPSQSDKSFSLREALLVQGHVDRLILAESKPQARDLRRIGVSQSELNSYIAYLIDLQPDQPLKELFLKLYDKNRVEGKIHFDLRGQNLPKILRPEMNFFFEGVIEINNTQIRIKLKNLFLEQQPIKPMILDLVIMIAAKVSGSDSGSLSDWYPLPYGIDDIRIQRGRAVFLY